MLPSYIDHTLKGSIKVLRKLEKVKTTRHGEDAKLAKRTLVAVPVLTTGVVGCDDFWKLWDRVRRRAIAKNRHRGALAATVPQRHQTAVAHLHSITIHYTVNMITSMAYKQTAPNTHA